jgi:protein-L-isoaspartate(D-aspartate) O-methyltransferase
MMQAMIELATVRRAYAEALRAEGPIRSAAVVEAFATVPREAFAGPPPWTVMQGPDLAVSETSDPAELYGNSLISLVASKGLNNGEPLFWAKLFDQLAPAPGQHVVHVGAGAGYYTAIVAEW